MKSLSPTKSQKMFIAVCGVTLALGAVAFRVQAAGWDKKTVITVDQPIQVTDTYLDPGTYVLKLADLGSDRHIVQIFDADQTQIINTVMAIPNYRLQPTGDSRFAFWETPPGTARALRAWFYPGDNFGQEFRYPSHLRQIAVNSPPPLLAPTTSELQAAASAPATSEPALLTPPPAVKPETPQQQAPVEVAQNEQPPAEVAQNTPAPASPPAVASQPQELPKTATPFPMIGLAGLLSLAGYGLVLGLVRRKDSA